VSYFQISIQNANEYNNVKRAEGSFQRRKLPRPQRLEQIKRGFFLQLPAIGALYNYTGASETAYEETRMNAGSIRRHVITRKKQHLPKDVAAFCKSLHGDTSGACNRLDFTDISLRIRAREYATVIIIASMVLTRGLPSRRKQSAMRQPLSGDSDDNLRRARGNREERDSPG
jgi:hypothetical protein